jgi:hypothetical protein
MQAHEGLRYRGQEPPRRVPSGRACPPPAASETEQESARAAAAAAPPAGPPSPPSTLEWLKSAFPHPGPPRAAGAERDSPLLGGPAREAAGAAAGAAAARASAAAPPADPAEAAAVEDRRRTWAGVARSLGAAVRDPADYMDSAGSYITADALLQAKGGTLLPAHFAMVRHLPRFRRSAECASVQGERFDSREPLLLRLPFARFAPADVALLLRWLYKQHLPSGRGGATEEEFKALAALFVEDDQAAAWWRMASWIDDARSRGGARGA